MEYLFSYGTLQQPEVQQKSFARRLEGYADVLAGYALRTQAISDVSVIAVSGLSQHPIAHFTGLASDQVTGLAFRVSADELLKADAYEVSDYQRVEVRLASGRTAFAYVASRDG